MFLSTTRWFGIWLDWICVTYVGCVTYACLGLRNCTLFLYRSIFRNVFILIVFIRFYFLFVLRAIYLIYPLAMTGSEAGLAISSAMALTGMFQWGVRYN